MSRSHEIRHDQPALDVVDAMHIARDHVQKHAPSYWMPDFMVVYLADVKKWNITTNCNAMGGNAEITIDAESGRVLDAEWNRE